MEVFTFLKMTAGERRRPSAAGGGGGGPDRIHVIAIAGKDGAVASQREARQQLSYAFATFNAAKAQCHKAGDRERLLAVIEAGFGDFEVFNALVKDVFRSRLEKSRTSRLGTQELRSVRESEE